MINIINTAVCHILKFLRINPKSSHHKEKHFFHFINFVFIGVDKYSQNLLDSHFMMCALCYISKEGFPVVQKVKNLPAMQETQV